MKGNGRRLRRTDGWEGGAGENEDGLRGSFEIVAHFSISHHHTALQIQFYFGPRLQNRLKFASHSCWVILISKNTSKITKVLRL